MKQPSSSDHLIFVSVIQYTVFVCASCDHPLHCIFSLIFGVFLGFFRAFIATTLKAASCLEVIRGVIGTKLRENSRSESDEEMEDEPIRPKKTPRSKAQNKIKSDPPSSESNPRQGRSLRSSGPATSPGASEEEEDIPAVEVSFLSLNSRFI